MKHSHHCPIHGCHAARRAAIDLVRSLRWQEMKVRVRHA